MTKDKLYEDYWSIAENYAPVIVHPSSIEVMKVNPETNEVDDNPKLNTKVVYWLEGGMPGEHDVRLDCGGDTFEEAYIKYIKLVKKYYKPE